VTKEEFVHKWRMWIHAEGMAQFERELNDLIKSEINKHRALEKRRTYEKTN
jgi:hypothetical protein